MTVLHIELSDSGDLTYTSEKLYIQNNSYMKGEKEDRGSNKRNTYITA